MQTTATMAATRRQSIHHQNGGGSSAIVTGSQGLLTTGHDPTTMGATTGPRKSISIEARPPQYSRRSGSTAGGGGPSISTLMFMKKQISNFHTRKRHSIRAGSLVSRKPMVENSYRTEPKLEEQYREDRVRNIVHNSLSFFLDGMHYEQKACAKVTKVICDDIKRKMKYHFNCPRFKIVVHTVVGEKSDQGMEVASRCLTDDKTDNSATANYIKGDICGTATVFWIYYE